MRVIIEIPWGPHRGTRAILEPGRVLAVGRDSEDLPLPRDPQLSRIHFELAWDGIRCVMRDRKSMTGTFVNGRPVEEATVKNGDWIRAGDTVLSVYFENASRRRPRPKWPGRSGNVLTRARKASVLAALMAEPRTLFAVLDPTRGKRVLTLLRESVEEQRSLYEGARGDALAEVAPHLVKLPRDSRLLVSLVQEGWQRRWGIFLTSNRPFKEVRRHLRRFLMVQEEDTGEELYFRFYDPVALAAFLPTCSPAQREEFHGEIEAFLAESELGSVLRFVRERPEPEILD